MTAQPIEKKLVAVCGKGGTGKTAFAALLLKALLRSGRRGRILAIDADPAMGLALAVGVGVKKTVGGAREEILRKARAAGRSEKEAVADAVDYLLFEALCEGEEFSLLAMGRSEKVGCYCSVNGLIRDGMRTLIEHFDTIIIDAEAGVEQINREVVKQVDTPVIITDPSRRGLQTALLIRDTARRHRLVASERFSVAVNRARDGVEALVQALREAEMEPCAVIPEDEELGAYDAACRPLLELPEDNAAYLAVAAAAEKLGL